MILEAGLLEQTVFNPFDRHRRRREAKGILIEDAGRLQVFGGFTAQARIEQTKMLHLGKGFQLSQGEMRRGVQPVNIAKP